MIDLVQPSPRTIQGLSTDTRPAFGEGIEGDIRVTPGTRFLETDAGRTLVADRNRQVKSVRVIEGGASYQAGDGLTFEPAGAVGTVGTVDGSGTIQTLTLTMNGAYSEPPTVTASTTNGSGAELEAVLSDGWRVLSSGDIVDT